MTSETPGASRINSPDGLKEVMLQIDKALAKRADLPGEGKDDHPDVPSSTALKTKDPNPQFRIEDADVLTVNARKISERFERIVRRYKEANFELNPDNLATISELRAVIFGGKVSDNELKKKAVDHYEQKVANLIEQFLILSEERQAQFLAANQRIVRLREDVNLVWLALNRRNELRKREYEKKVGFLRDKLAKESEPTKQRELARAINHEQQNQEEYLLGWKKEKQSNENIMKDLKAAAFLRKRLGNRVLPSLTSLISRAESYLQVARSKASPVSEMPTPQDLEQPIRFGSQRPEDRIRRGQIDIAQEPVFENQSERTALVEQYNQYVGRLEKIFEVVPREYLFLQEELRLLNASLSQENLPLFRDFSTLITRRLKVFEAYVSQKELEAEKIKIEVIKRVRNLPEVFDIGQKLRRLSSQDRLKYYQMLIVAPPSGQNDLDSLKKALEGKIGRFKEFLKDTDPKARVNWGLLQAQVIPFEKELAEADRFVASCQKDLASELDLKVSFSDFSEKLKRVRDIKAQIYRAALDELEQPNEGSNEKRELSDDKKAEIRAAQVAFTEFEGFLRAPFSKPDFDFISQPEIRYKGLLKVGIEGVKSPQRGTQIAEQKAKADKYVSELASKIRLVEPLLDLVLATSQEELVKKVMEAKNINPHMPPQEWAQIVLKSLQAQSVITTS